MKAVLIALLLFSTNVFAGAADPYFDCKSSSGRTTLKGTIPGDALDYVLKFTIDGKTSAYYSQYLHGKELGEGEQMTGVIQMGSMEEKNLSFAVVALEENAPTLKYSANAVFKFSVLPETVKVKQTRNGEKGTLSATIQGVDPRDTTKDSPAIQVSCEYNYEI